VSPDGSDSNDGSESHPFQTLPRAQEAARNAVATDTGFGQVVVKLTSGEYFLNEPLRMDARDAGKTCREVIYRAAEGAHPVITGGVKPGTWEQDPSTMGRKFGIMRAKMAPGLRSRQLLVNGNRATRARTDGPSGYPVAFHPTYDDHGPVAPKGGIEYLIDDRNATEWQNPSTWKNMKQVEAVALLQWKMDRIPLDTFYTDVNSTVLKGQKVGLLTLADTSWRNSGLFMGIPYLSTPKGMPGVWSFFAVSWFENCYQFLDKPGEWYHDERNDSLYYIPLLGENMATSTVYFPVTEQLLVVEGTPEQPVSNIRFEGITFAHATWLQPSGPQGYIADQGGFHITGVENDTNSIGHVQHVVRTPGNISLKYATHVTFANNAFEHMGGVALDLDKGCQHVTIDHNAFTDISSAAIQMGGVSVHDAHTDSAVHWVTQNVVSNNTIHRAGVDYVDAAGIMLGFVSHTQISHNEIRNVPWAGISLGWGWGLLDSLHPSDEGYPGTYSGVIGGCSGLWGRFSNPSNNHHNVVEFNKISEFVNQVWDGGAIYTTGFQGSDFQSGLQIKGNVAFKKRPNGGSNIYYTDGGTRYVTLVGNVSFDNPQGHVFMGPPLVKGDTLNATFYYLVEEMENLIPYGSEIGGCCTFGDILYINNYCQNLWDKDVILALLLDPERSGWPFNPLYFDPCKNKCVETNYPIRLHFFDNHLIKDKAEVPSHILNRAGVKQ
jgi:hypothetical protein